jgi:hypothetical protein
MEHATMSPSLSAEAYAYGPDSTVPDDPTAIDFDLWEDHECIGGVTLRIDPATGEYGPWGSPRHWASDGAILWMSGDTIGDLDPGRVARVVDACRREFAEINNRGCAP